MAEELTVKDASLQGDNTAPVVLVVGMHRSGTSAICRLLDAAGVAFGDNVIPPSSDNPLGFWEDRDFIAANDALLGGAEAWRLVTLPALAASDQWLTDATAFVTRRLAERPTASTPIGLKDPRICRTLEHWLPVLGKPKVVFVVRNPLSVAHSLHQRDGLSVEYGLALWFVHNVEALKSLCSQGLDFQVVHYDLLMAGEAQAQAALQDFLGLALDWSLLERSLQHQRFNAADLHEDAFIENLAARFWQALVGRSPDYQAFERGYASIIALYRPFSELAAQREEARAYSAHVEADNQVLKDHLMTLRSELDEAKGYGAHLEGDIGTLQGHIARLQKDVSSLQASVVFEQAQYQSLKEATDALLAQQTAELAEAAAQYQALQADFEQMERVRWQVDVLLQQVYGSYSWRITAPLRFARRALGAGWRKTLSPLRWLASYLLRRLASVKARALVSSRQNAAALQQLVAKRPNEQFWNPFPDTTGADLPTIGISVVLYNNGRWLRTFIDSLVHQDYPLDRIKLFFVDHSSNDDTFSTLGELLAEHEGVFASVDVARRANTGFGSGHDYAIQRLEVDYVLVSNVDLEFQRGALIEIVSTALSDSGVASWECRQSPYEHPKYVDPVTLHVNWSSHACVLLNREAYLAVGGYEHRIFMYGEDVELSYRFRRAGYALKYVPRAVVFHHTYESAGDIKPIQFTGSTAANLLIRARYGTLSDVLIGYFLLFGLALRGAGFAGSRGLVWRALPRTLATSAAFLATREKSAAAFPFRGFDYDLCREGAFWESDRAVIDDAQNLPLVTVITRTVEGREALLNQAMMSVMNQSYAAIEHIIAEDGGDSAKTLCDKVASISPQRYRIRHLPCPKKGRSHAANRALDVATGEYVVILDDDDLLLPDHIETLVTAIIRHQCDAAYALAWDTPVEYSDKSKGQYTEYAHLTLGLFYQEFDREVLLHHNFLPIQSVLFKRSLAGDTVRFDEDLDYLEDWVFWKRLSYQADFRFVCKTTSLYKTPLSAKENYARKKLLDDAYSIARTRPEY